MPENNELEGLNERIVAYVRYLGPKADGSVRITGHGLARDLGVSVQEVREALTELDGYVRAERRVEPTSEHWDVFGPHDNVTV